MSISLVLAAIDFRDPIWQFWIGATSLALSALAILVTVVLAVRGRRRKLLTYEVVSNSSVINADNDVGEDLELLLEGHPVNHVRLHVIKVLNAGNTAISPEDYPNQLGFEFTSASYPHPLILCSIHRTEPENLLPRSQRKSLLSIDTPDRTLMVLKPPLLNPHDALFLKVLLLAKDRKSTTMTVIGQVKEGLLKSYTTPPPRIARRVVMAGVAAAFVLGLLISNSFSLIGAFAGGNCALGSIKVDGSTSFYSAASTEAEKYLNNCPVARISLNESSSGLGLQDLKNGKLSIANSELTDKSLQDHPVAAIVFALIVNKPVGLHNLDLQQIQGIYSGRIRSWKQIDANAAPIPIRFFGRQQTSGTYAAFQKYLLQGHPDLTPHQDVLDRSSDVVDKVANTIGAIGYADLGDALDNSNVSILNINGYSFSSSFVERGLYPFWAIEHMYTNQNPDALSTSFITYVKQDLQTKDAFISLSAIPDNVLASHR